MTTYAMDRVIHVLGLGIRTHDVGRTRRSGGTGELGENQRACGGAYRTGRTRVVGTRFSDGAVRLPSLIERLCPADEGGDPKRVHARISRVLSRAAADGVRAVARAGCRCGIDPRCGGIAILAHPYRIAEDESGMRCWAAWTD